MLKFANIVIGLILAACLGFLAGRNTQHTSLIGAASGSLTTAPFKLSLSLVNDIDPKGARLAQLDTLAIDALVGALQNRGAKVDMSPSEENGFSFANISVDGERVTPLIVGCKACEPIVFEY